jgi:aminopeptidase N
MNVQWLFFVSLILFRLLGGISESPGRHYSHLKQVSDERSNYDVKFYGLDLQVSDSSIYLSGTVAILIDPLVQSLQHVVFDFSNALSTDSVTLNGEKVSYVHSENQLKITLTSPIDAGNLSSFQIYYHGLGKNTGPYSGIYNKFYSSWNKHITWTLSEPFHAMNWFPCKQVLTDKADSVYVFLSTDSNLKAGSNGILTAQVPLPGNRIRYEWKSRHPINYYLISFAVSDYMDYSFYVKKTGENDSILVQNYIYNNTDYFDLNKAAIDKTGDMILLYSDLFGEYPFADEKYGHCVAPLGGGMEHQTMTTLVNFSFLLVAHELAHQWFGDLVTCSSWQDIWINEGFASYGEYLSNQYLKSQSNADSWMAGVHDYVKSVPGGSVYLPEKDINDEDRIFDYRLTYNKGAAIIHMIRQEVGNDSIFFVTLKTFLQKYRNNDASGIDFRDHLNDITGKDFTAFFDQWYFGEGYPVHSINWSKQNDTLSIFSLQTASTGNQLFTVPLEFKINVDNRDTLITLRQTGNFNAWKIYLPGNVTSVIADPNHWLIIEAGDVQNTTPVERESTFRIVPNPAKERVNVYFTGNTGTYSLYLADSSGKILSSWETAEEHMVITLNKLATGMYFIIIRDRKGIYQAKFIVY